MAQAHDIEAVAADWLAARDGDDWTPDRQHALEAWLAESTAHRVAYLRLDAAWQRADRLQVLRAAAVPASVASAAAASSHWTGSSQEGWQQAWQRRLQWLRSGLHPGPVALGMTVMAGLVALVIGIALHLDAAGSGQLHATGVGERAVLALRDGSRLTLNTATRLRTDMRTDQRRVWLDAGEAYFEVAHDARRPFVVLSGAHRITVLGTKFSVHREGDQLRVLVVEGRVELSTGATSAAVLAKADNAVATPGLVRLRHESPRELDASMRWLEGKLQFDGVTLEAAAAQFNRYNQKQLVMADAEAGRIRIGGTFDANNVEQFARLLHSGFGLEVAVNDDVIRVGVTGVTAVTGVKR